MFPKEYVIGCKGFVIVDVVGHVGEGTAVQDSLNFRHQGVELWIREKFVVHEAYHYFFGGTNKSLPGTSHVWGAGWIEMPLDVDGGSEILNFVMV